MKPEPAQDPLLVPPWKYGKAGQRDRAQNYIWINYVMIWYIKLYSGWVKPFILMSKISLNIAYQWLSRLLSINILPRQQLILTFCIKYIDSRWVPLVKLHFKISIHYILLKVYLPSKEFFIHQNIWLIEIKTFQSSWFWQAGEIQMVNRN